MNRFPNLLERQGGARNIIQEELIRLKENDYSPTTNKTTTNGQGEDEILNCFQRYHSGIKNKYR